VASDPTAPRPPSGRTPIQAAAQYAGCLAALAVFLIYVLNAWTPSHYGEATRILGIPRSGPVIGEAQGIRSDEWAVTTPYFQISVANNLGPRDETSPYKEPLKAFFALPSRDWSMAFKPDLWGFLALDPAHAYSLHYALLALAMLAGFAILLRQLGCRPGLALGVSALLFLSQFVQVWWTSNAPVLALAPWPVIAVLWRGPWWARMPAIAYATAIWLIGQLYPPFIVSAGLAFGVLVGAFRPETLRPAHLAPALAAAAVGIGIAWLHYADLIGIMAATVYPGQRIASGGGEPPLQLLAHLLPYVASMRFEPLGLWPSNACEIGVVGSFLPLAGLIFCDHAALARWGKAHGWALTAWLCGLALMIGWMVLPIPGHLVPLVNLAPPHRMLWGFGLLLLLGSAVILDATPWRLTPLRIGAFLAVVVGAWAVSKLWLTATPLQLGRFDLMAAPILVALALVAWVRPHWLPPQRLVLSALLLTSVMTFGRFNPVQSAKPIFEHRKSQVVDAFAAYAAANPRGWVITPAMYGSVINGAGVPAINHTLLQPQLRLLQAAYPDLEPMASNALFNRYMHVLPQVQWAPKLVQADLVTLPPDPFAIPLPVELAAAAGNPAAAGLVETVEFVRLGEHRWGATLAGWAPWSGVDATQRLKVAMAPQVGRIVSASAFRLPRPDIVMAQNDPSRFAAGLGLRLEIETLGALEKGPAEALSVIATDGRQGDRLLRQAPGP
jgi:hypothetical protein